MICFVLAYLKKIPIYLEEKAVFVHKFQWLLLLLALLIYIIMNGLIFSSYYSIGIGFYCLFVPIILSAINHWLIKSNFYATILTKSRF